jgi:hypothetical protein
MIDGNSFISQINRGCDPAPDQESKPRQICPSAAANEKFPQIAYKRSYHVPAAVEIMK